MNWSKRTALICMTSSALTGLVCAQEPAEPAVEQVAPATQVADDALKQLQAAVDSNPTDLKAQLSLAQRLYERGRHNESWQRLRGVYDKTPEDQGVLLGLQAVMDSYKRQGLLNVSTPEKQVTELLGQPHHTRKMPWGVRQVYGMMAVDFRDGKIWELIKLLGATEELFDASHVVDVDLGTKPWNTGIRQKGDGITTAFLFPQGESIAKWNELVTVERFVRQAEGKTMKEVLAIVQKQITSNGSQAHVTVVEQDDTTAIFGVDHPARDGQPAMQQLVRLWMGPRDVHRLAYTHQGATPSDEEAEKWLGIFKAAKLKPYDPSVSKTSLAFSPQSQVKNLAETVRADLRKAIQFRPTEKAISAIAANEDARKKLQAYCDSVYKELDQAGAACQQNQTEILVFGPDEKELPGGYKTAREQFKTDVKFYGFKYVAPGETSGMSFDGAFEVEGKWYLLPKAHRAFR